MEITIDEIINGERAQALCDILLVTHDKLSGQPTLHKPPLMTIPRVIMNEPIAIVAGKLHGALDTVPKWRLPIIFVFTDLLDQFFSDITAHIKRPYILVTHNADHGVHDAHVKHLDNEMLVLWLAQNCYIRHKKMVNLPIGIANTMWPHGDLGAMSRALENTRNKTGDFMASFNVFTNRKKRSLVEHQLQRLDIPNLPCHLDYESYLCLLATYKYSVCPPGNGVDTHRFWESIYMRAIPIVEDHVMFEGFGKDLPCIRLSSFSEIDKKELLANYKAPEVPKSAFMSYYKSMVSHHVVLVHVGSHMCEYIPDCIAQIRIWNPHCPIHLGISKSNMSANAVLLSKYNVNLIALEDTPMSKHHTLFLEKSAHNTSERNGFWRHASERIFYVHDIVEHLGLRNVLHFENDQLIFFDIARTMPVFAMNYQIGIPFDSPHRAIPSVIFFKDSACCAALTEYMASQAHRGIDDMHIMRDFQKNSKHNGLLRGLPIVATNSQMVTSGSLSIEYATNYEEFDSIFDAACLGQYIGGVDPRNIPGDTRGFVNTDTPLRADLMELHWRKDVSTGRWEVYAANVKVNNLHMHCKNLHHYMSDNHSWIRACNKGPRP